MRQNLICTVGTSLLNNLKNQDEEIKVLLNAKNCNALSLWLLNQKGSDRVCGAEINSITSIINKNFIEQKQNLIFLVSDTDDGRFTGQLLKLYYSNARNPISFNYVDFRVLDGLRDDDVKSFQKKGLKNLVKEISQEARKFDPSSIAINATGGYKAQISFAGMIGQALEIPVYYLFEKFSEVIALPPQPISLDLAFWLNNYLYFRTLEIENTVLKSSLDLHWDDPKLTSLIDEEFLNGESYVSFSAMGILFHERAWFQFSRQAATTLSQVPQDETLPELKAINLRDDHGKDILIEFSKKIRRSPYVKKIVNSLPFNPRRVDPIRRTTADGLVEFVLTWTDAGYGICIQTTGSNLLETNVIALHLQSEFTY